MTSYKLKVTIATDEGVIIDQIDLWTADPARTIAALVDKITACKLAALNQFLGEENT